MLRLLVLLLVLANVGFYAWSQGLLVAVLPWPPDTREPQRLQQQVRPEAVRLAGPDGGRTINAGGLNTASASAPAGSASR